MITLRLTDKQEAELYQVAFYNHQARNRKKAFIVYLRSMKKPCHEIAKLTRVNNDTVTNHIKKYVSCGLQGLLAESYHQSKSQLEPYREQLKELLKKQPPHTINQASEMIFETTGIRLKHSACRDFLKKIGMNYKCCGLVPGKIADDPVHQKVQQEFHDQKLQPLLSEAKVGKHTVLFVDAAHFVMGAYLGMLWCFVRQLLPSASGRKRHNILGAYDPVRHEAITVTNDTYINQHVFCTFLDKIAATYAESECPITLILDNARYQKCQSVFDKAEALGIELLYLPPYSPNLNLIERLWRFVKKQVLYCKHYDKFVDFKNSIDTCMSELATKFKSNMESLITFRFQLFTKKTENLTA
jgi:transposase